MHAGRAPCSGSGHSLRRIPWNRNTRAGYIRLTLELRLRVRVAGKLMRLPIPLADIKMMQ